VRTVFFDIDTQNDFVLPAGALYVPGAEHVLPVIARLNRHAAAQGIPEFGPHAERWPAHCIAGTLGQQKPAGTVLERRVTVPSKRGAHAVAGAQQILLEKQHLDCFTNHNLAAVLEELAAEQYVVYGVVTEYCVQYATRGLLKTGKPVLLVRDAIRSIRQQDADAMLAEFQDGGGALTTAAALGA
jgi:nicotinamidase/pyrazinamidase